MTKDFIYFKNKAKLAFRKRQYSRVLEILSCANVFLENLNAKQSLYFTMLCMLSDMALEYEDEHVRFLNIIKSFTIKTTWKRKKLC